MSKYAVSEDGVEALQLSSNKIIESVQTLYQLITTLSSTVEGSAALGPHASTIKQLLLELYTNVKDSIEPAKQVSEKLNEVAEAYQDIIENNLIRSNGIGNFGGNNISSSRQTVTASGHQSYITDYQKQIEAVQNDIQAGSGIEISPQRAAQLLHGIHEFSGTASTRIRKAYDNPNADIRDKELLAAVDDYIRSAPKWKGQVFRGINVSKEQAAQLLSGSPIDMMGPSSWSSDRSVAERFSNGYKEQRIIFVLDDNISGASITHIGTWDGTESEVTAPSGVKYYPERYWTDIIDGDNVTFISVHE